MLTVATPKAALVLFATVVAAVVVIDVVNNYYKIPGW